MYFDVTRDLCCISFLQPYLYLPQSHAIITTGPVVAFIPHILSTSILRSLHFESFSVTLSEVSEVFFSVGMVPHINQQATFFLFLFS